jgi:hypothetical protein
MANAAKYVKATSTTDIKPNNCLIGENQSGSWG